MNHLSLFWESFHKDQYLRAIESDFCKRVYRSIKADTLRLPPIPEVVLQLQRACQNPETGVKDVAQVLLGDASLTAAVIRAANSAIFSPRTNQPCHDIHIAVSRLGITRVLGIATAHSIQVLKNGASFGDDCNQLLFMSNRKAREFAGTMALICTKINDLDEEESVEPEKALLVGLLADIGLYSVISEFHLYLDEGNYLDFDIAKHIFFAISTESSQYTLRHWGFDPDFIEVSLNRRLRRSVDDISYLDVARMANHLLMFRADDDAIDDHDVEITSTGAEALYELSNLNDRDFNHQIRNIMDQSGL